MRTDGHKARNEAQTGGNVEGAGKLEIPSATSCDGEVSPHGDLSRRSFLIASGAVSIGMLAGCGGGGTPAPRVGVEQTKAYRLSTRRVASASNAAKAHAANKRFISPDVADANRAHPGDKSRIVTIDVSPATWNLWFGRGQAIVDLRRI